MLLFCCLYFFSVRRPQIITPTATLFHYTTRFRSLAPMARVLPLADPDRLSGPPAFRVSGPVEAMACATFIAPLEPRLTSAPAAVIAPADAISVTTRLPAPASSRSEERRVGKECVSTCRSRWSPYH